MNKESIDKIALTIPSAPVQIKPPSTVGRPTKYTQTTGNAILHDIATTTRQISQICAQHDITEQTLYYWIGAHDVFFQSYLRALEIRSIAEVAGVDGLLSQLVDYIEHSDVDPREKHVRIQALRLRVEQIRWKASKHNRRLYGDKLDIDQQLTINPQDARSDAWQLAQAAEYREIPSPPNDNNNVDN